MELINKKAISLFGAIAFCFSVFAQNEVLFNDIHFYESLTTVKEKLGQNVLSHTVFTRYEPTFPLASETEEHLICTNLKTANGILAQVVFTFADNKLHYIEAKGNTLKTLIEKRNDTAVDYLNFKVYKKSNLFADLENDAVRFVSKEAAHPNLFTWSNPFISEKQPENYRYNTSIEVPSFLEMGGELDRLRPMLIANAATVTEQKLDGSDPNAQLQLNCFGVEYAGFPRKVEARFGDGRLNAVWILTAKAEENRIRKKLIKSFGEPIFKNADWEIFNDWTIGLRKDKPEILLLTPELGQFYKKNYFNQ
ncbi:hypothetical protein [uncultured Croceitalea sp.]|uniref:hypothetical protein n=1 Tax=uncultured Croceitalea sp. TaxID=1798908 RepID=UPI0033061E48